MEPSSSYHLSTIAYGQVPNTTYTPSSNTILPSGMDMTSTNNHSSSLSSSSTSSSISSSNTGGLSSSSSSASSMTATLVSSNTVIPNNTTIGVPIGAMPSTPRVLYWGSGSPPAWRVLITLHEKKLSYKSEMITFESGVLKTAPMLSLNPRGLVPIFIDGDVRMYESLAILHYLDDFYTEIPLLPKERIARARALTRMEEANNVSATAGEVVYYVRRTPPGEINEEYLSQKKLALHTELKLWETYLVGTDYLAGTGYGPTLADMSFFPSLAYMVRLGLRLDENYPHLFNYFQRMCSRPSVISTWPPHWKTVEGLGILS